MKAKGVQKTLHWVHAQEDTKSGRRKDRETEDHLC